MTAVGGAPVALLDLVGFEPRGLELLDREAGRARGLEDRLLLAHHDVDRRGHLVEMLRPE